MLKPHRNKIRVRQLSVLMCIGVVAFLPTACGKKTIKKIGITAAFASFDPYARVRQRVAVGLFTNDGRGVAYGTISVTFEQGDKRIKRVAKYEAVVGDDRRAGKPRVTALGEARGAYVTNLTFPRDGVWDLNISANISGEERTATTTALVAKNPQVLAVGDKAPLTKQPLAGDKSVPVTALDSNARDGQVRYPRLHNITVADAVKSGKPILINVGTPAYCESRFCGPTVDLEAELEKKYGDRMHFIFLEIYKDYSKNEINDAAATWVTPKSGAEASEPWTFLINQKGKVVGRWDNVVTRGELESAITSVLRQQGL